MGYFQPLLQVLKEPLCAGALRPQPKAWPGASTDNFLRGRFNGLSEVGVVLFSLLFKQAGIYKSQIAGLKFQTSFFI